MASLSTGSVNFPTIVYENSAALVEDLATKMGTTACGRRSKSSICLIFTGLAGLLTTASWMITRTCSSSWA